MQSPPHRYQDSWQQSAPRARTATDPLPTQEPPTWETPEDLAHGTAQAERRRGLTGAWLDLVAPPPAPAGAALAERERVRRAELSSYVLLGVLLVGLALIPNGLANFPTLVSAGIIIASAVAAGLLNRTDHTMSAALVLIAAFTLALGGALLWAPQLDLMWMPALDFFAVPVLLAAILLPRQVPFIVGGVNIALVTALLLLKPRDPALSSMVASLGVYHFVVRPAMLIVIVAIAGWLWSRSVEQAIARADRAEEVAAAEHQLARQKVLLERGIQGLLETHVRIANGDFSARAHVGQDNVLWQIAVSLNNLVSRLGKWAQVDYRLRRTDAEIDRLAGSLERARQGQRALWPALSGTRVDRLTLLLATPTRGQQVVGAAPVRPHGQLGPTAATAQPGGPRPQMMPGMMPGMAPGMMPRMMPGQWREASIQHMAPRPFTAQPPFGAPTARGGQMPLQSTDGPGVWRSPAAEAAAGDDSARGSMAPRPQVPDQTFPRLEAMPPAGMDSRRARTHAYRQVPMPDWLATHLPPLAAEHGEVVAGQSAAYASASTPVAEGALAEETPTSGTSAMDTHLPAIALGPSPAPAEAAPAAMQDERLGQRTEVEESDVVTWDADPAGSPHGQDGGASSVDWPGYLRQLARESE